MVLSKSGPSKDRSDKGNPWGLLVQFAPERVEQMVQRIFEKYAQSFKPISVDVKNSMVTIELGDGRTVRERI